MLETCLAFYRVVPWATHAIIRLYPVRFRKDRQRCPPRGQCAEAQCLNFMLRRADLRLWRGLPLHRALDIKSLEQSGEMYYTCEWQAVCSL